MATREALLHHLWQEVIDPNLDEAVPQRIAAYGEQRPGEPFADSGAAIGRLLALGADPRDLCLLMRGAAYEAVFGTLYALGDPGADGDDVFNLHEDLLGADPSGREGRPVAV